MSSPSQAEPKARRAIAVGLALTFLGLALVATASKAVGGPIVAIGWSALLYGIHAFGRLGTVNR